MATREQLIGALRQADAAGDTQAAQRFAELIKAQSEPTEAFPGQSTLGPRALELPVEQQQEILKARRQQQQAGGYDDDLVPGGVQRQQAMEDLRQRNPYLAQTIEETSGPERLAVGFQQGLRTVGRGAGKILGQDYFSELSDPALQELQDISVGAQTGKIAGEVAPFLAAAPLTGTVGTGVQLTRGGATLVPQVTSTAGRAAITGSLGAAEGGTIAAGEDRSAEEVALSALLGGTMGAGSEVLVPVLNRSARKVLGKLGFKGSQVVDEAGNLTPDAKQTLADSGIEIDDFIRQTVEEGDIGEQARKDLFEKLGLTPTQAQVTRDKGLFGEQVEAFTQEGKVTEALERQDRVLQELAQKNLGSVGGVAERSNQTVSDAIIDKAVQLDNEIGGLYKAARETAPDAKNVRFNKATSSLRGDAPSDDLAGGVVKALKGRMEQMGVVDGFKPSGRVSVESAEELRKFANTLIPSANDFGRQIIRRFKDSLDDDALSAAGKDFFEQARNAKANFEKGLSTAGKSKFSKRKKSLVRDILEEKIPEDKIAERVIRRGSAYDSKSLKELRDYLTSGNENQIKQGMQAWNDIRATAMRDVFDDAFEKVANREGVRAISRAGVERGIKKIGPEKFDVLFNPSERSFMKDLASVAALKEAPPGVKASPSGPAIRKLQEALSRIPWLGGGIANDVIDNARSKASEKRVPQTAEYFQVSYNKIFENKLRKGSSAAALSVIPVTTAAEDEDR